MIWVRLMKEYSRSIVSMSKNKCNLLFYTLDLGKEASIKFYCLICSRGTVCFVQIPSDKTFVPFVMTVPGKKMNPP